MSQALYDRARAILPGGVSSPVRSFAAVGGTPVFAAKASGAYLYDHDGRAYLDLIGGWGAAIAGHAHPQVVAAVQQAAAAGLGFGVPTEPEVLLGEELRRRMPHLEKVRFTCSGTEAVMSALRLARAATGREKILTFAGGYHGHADAFLVEAGSGLATGLQLASPGVPAALAEITRVAPYGDLEAVAKILRRESIAAIFVEPVAANMGLVPPAPGFLEGLRQLSQKHGTLLVFDEVITGFRVHRGGAAGRYGVVPDLTTLGKIVGGGLPCGALAGRAELLDQLAPVGKVYHAGTAAGNPLAMAAGLATLKLLDAEAYEQLETLGAELEKGLLALLAAKGQKAAVNRVGSLLTIFWGVEQVRDYDDARQSDRALFRRLFHRLLEQGMHLPPSPFESLFLSLAHTGRDLENLLAALAAALSLESP